MGIIWVGMDAHKKAINVAALFADEREAHEWALENKPAAIRRLVKKLVREADGREVRCCYEAGPCGYALQRQIEAAGPVSRGACPRRWTSVGGHRGRGYIGREATIPRTHL